MPAPVQCSDQSEARIPVAEHYVILTENPVPGLHPPIRGRVYMAPQEQHSRNFASPLSLGKAAYTILTLNPNSRARSTVLKTLPDFFPITGSVRRCLTQRPGNSMVSLDSGANISLAFSLLEGCLGAVQYFGVLTGPGHRPT